MPSKKLYRKNLRLLWRAQNKWFDILCFNKQDLGSKDCSFCLEFNNYYNHYGNRCEGCLIRRYTKKQYCNATPYEEWISETILYNGKIGDTYSRKAARKEYHFIESVRKNYIKINKI